jgi:integrase
VHRRPGRSPSWYGFGRDTPETGHRGASQIVTIAEAAGLDQDITTHIGRHTFAATLKMRGVASGASFGKIRERPLPATSPFEMDQGRLVVASSHAS